MLKKLKFKKIYLSEREFIRNTIFWMTRSDITDDLVQETFIKAWNKFDDFKNDSSYRTWLYRIAMNTTYDYFRKKKFHDASNENFENESDLLENNFIHRDIVSKTLMTLDEQSREVFNLFYKFEYSNKEISELLNIPIGTVKSRLFKAREIFKENYTKMEIGDKDE